MALRVFPTHLFCFENQEADIERRILTGGESLAGASDVVATDGGGRFFAEFAEAYLDEREVALAWRSISATLQDGVVPVIVPIGDIRHQFGREIRVPDTVGFWTEAEYDTGVSAVTLAADAALRATTLSLTLAYLAEPLRGGMWLSIDHTVLRHRAYRIGEVLSQDGTTASVTISPPLREATLANAPVEMDDPRCVCRIDGQMRSPTSMGFASGQVRFVEHFLAPGETYP
jgi:hypothetical protein